MNNGSTVLRPLAVAMAIAMVCIAFTAACSKAEPTGKEGNSIASEQEAGPYFVAGPQIDHQRWIKAQVTESKQRGLDVLVYVSASWCEPCQYFQRAVKSGSLKDDFPKLRLLKFDYDSDGEALATIGYTSTMLPLFVKPRSDGSAGTEMAAGSIKGKGAVDNLRGKLKQLLAPSP